MLKTRQEMIQELTADVIANPSDWDNDFLPKIAGLSDEWLKAHHGDIGYVWYPYYKDNTLDLGRAFA